MQGVCRGSNEIEMLVKAASLVIFGMGYTCSFSLPFPLAKQKGVDSPMFTLHSFLLSC
jgi:hypothetical protein